MTDGTRGIIDLIRRDDNLLRQGVNVHEGPEFPCIGLFVHDAIGDLDVIGFSLLYG